MRPHLPACLCLCLSAPLAGAGHAAAPGQAPVTVYRCIDATGHVTLGDVPCAEGAREQVREMQRPVDGEALVRTPAPAATPAAARDASPQVVVLRAPQPMYECVAPDGTRYTSDSGEGNPRWVPLWTLGYRSHGRGGSGRDRPAGGPLNDYIANRPLGGYVGAPTPRPSPSAAGGGPGHPRPPLGTGHGGFGVPGTWVRDSCHPLPQAEVCARLADRREAIRKRFFNAQERERDTLRVEERGINARLAADCAGP